MKGKSMIQTELIVLCDYASVSKEGKLSINGIFDEIRLTKLPGGIPRAFLVATIQGAPNTLYRFTIKLEHDGESKNLLNHLTLDTHTGPNGKNNLIVELVNLGFTKEGNYYLKIYHGDDEIGSILLKVIHVKPEPTYKLPN